ncbi:hypothetical protein [Pseudomonas moraviensis]
MRRNPYRNHISRSSSLKYYLRIGVGGAILVWTMILCAQTFQNYDQVIESLLPKDVLWKVIAREGKSKNYTDFISLDGGTVGIAHFATSGLGALYKNMNTSKYFSKSQEDMLKYFTADCRPEGKHGNDTGWGCYSKQWWNQGMRDFLNSNESRQVQDRAWAQMMQPVITRALSHDWQSERELAIALSIANSLGSSGFSRLADQNAWDAEKVLADYAKRSDHTRRRKEALDEHFP